MNGMYKPITVGFPLRGEWLSPNTPGTRIPSHGTNRFGTRYAYDFIQVDWGRKGYPAYRVSFLHYLLFGAPISEYYCWGQKVYSPCDGIVVAARDGYKERARTNLWSDMANANKNAHMIIPGNRRRAIRCGKLHHHKIWRYYLRCALSSANRLYSGFCRRKCY